MSGSGAQVAGVAGNGQPGLLGGQSFGYCGSADQWVQASFSERAEQSRDLS